MTSRPKLQRLITTLKELASAEIGEYAEPIDFVVQRVGMGQTVTALAHEVASAMGEPASRSWLSWRFNHLTGEAKKRIADARYVAACELAQGERDYGQAAAENDNTRRPRGSVPAPK